MEKLTFKTALPNMLKGAAMGIVEVIPGVSGGTIAFITGIYERLLLSIKSFGPQALKAWRSGGFKAFWKAIDGNFIASLLAGMATGLIFGVFVITWVFENYPVLLWAFFFGLIAGSVIFVGRRIEKWNTPVLVSLVIGTGVAFFISIAAPAQGSEAWWYIILSGTLAISALMLPGISGSFILLLLGMYTYIIPTVKHALITFELESLKILIIYAFGSIIGLVLFSRIVTWTLEKYHDSTMALLTGFMLGSINKLWPWRNVLEYRLDSKGLEVPLVERVVLPGQLDGEPFIFGVIILAVVGFISVFLLEWLGTGSANEKIEA